MKSFCDCTDTYCHTILKSWISGQKLLKLLLIEQKISYFTKMFSILKRPYVMSAVWLSACKIKQFISFSKSFIPASNSLHGKRHLLLLAELSRRLFLPDNVYQSTALSVIDG